MMANDFGIPAVDIEVPIGDNERERLTIILAGTFPRDRTIHHWRIESWFSQPKNWQN
jgi:hypothetical protein